MGQIHKAPFAIVVERAKVERVFIYPDGLDEEERRIFWDGEKFKQVPEEGFFEQATNYFVFNTPTFTIEEAALLWVIEDEGCAEKDSIIAAERAGCEQWEVVQEKRRKEEKRKQEKLRKERAKYEAGPTLIRGGLAVPEPQQKEETP